MRLWCYQGEKNLEWAYSGLSVVYVYADTLRQIVAYRKNCFLHEDHSDLYNDLKSVLNPSPYIIHTLCSLRVELPWQPLILRYDDIIPPGKCSNPSRNAEMVRLIVNLVRHIVLTPREVHNRLSA